MSFWTWTPKGAARGGIEGQGEAGPTSRASPAARASPRLDGIGQLWSELGSRIGPVKSQAMLAATPSSKSSRLMKIPFGKGSSTAGSALPLGGGLARGGRRGPRRRASRADMIPTTMPPAAIVQKSTTTTTRTSLRIAQPRFPRRPDRSNLAAPTRVLP